MCANAKLADTTSAIAKGSNTNTISNKNQLTTLSIDQPVIPVRYLRGPSSLSPSLDISLFNKAISVVVIESITASNFKLTASLSSIEVFNSAWRARLAELDDVVITVSASLS